MKFALGSDVLLFVLSFVTFTSFSLQFWLHIHLTHFTFIPIFLVIFWWFFCIFMTFTSFSLQFSLQFSLHFHLTHFTFIPIFLVIFWWFFGIFMTFTSCSLQFSLHFSLYSYFTFTSFPLRLHSFGCCRGGDPPEPPPHFVLIHFGLNTAL